MTNIIILLGVSSSGKSTVAREIQKLSNDKYRIVGFDYAVENLDKKYWPGGSHEKEGFYYIDIETNQGIFPDLRHGPIGEKFLSEMLNNIIELANSGENLIIDSVLSDNEYSKLLRECPNCQIFQVGIKPPLETVIEREKNRGNRKLGIGVAAYQSYYKNKKFDMIIDSNRFPADKAAKQILERIQTINNHSKKIK